MKIYASNVIVISGILLLTAAAGFAAGPITAPPALNDLIEEGLAANQSIASLRMEAAAMADQVPVAGALPDPMLGLGLLNMPTDTFEFDQEPMTQKQIAIEQQVPWPGKRGLRSRMAQMDAGHQTALLNAQILSLAQQISDRYYELGYMGINIENNKRLTELVAQIQREAQDRYVVGRGLQNNIFQAEMELSRLSEERIILETRLRTLQDQLNAMLNRTPYQPVEPPMDPGLVIPRVSLPEVKAAALVHNPELAAQQFLISRAEAAVELAKKGYLPDMNFRLAYGQREEDLTGRELPDFFSASVMVNLPVWKKSKQDKELESALNRLQAARSAYQNIKNSLPHQVDALAVELSDIRQRIALYEEELIPQAEAYARSVGDAYEVGQVEFDTMIRARMQVLNHELAAARLRFDLYRKLAALEQLVGRPLAQIGASGKTTPKEADHE